MLNFILLQAVEMADIMRSNGKIYVVIAIMGVSVLGMILLLLNLDRKIKKIENKIK